ncbi:23S rRNA (pseudouridine(1915)-N(3))-methyltransferase RlmH [Hydrogenimonas sp.]
MKINVVSIAKPEKGCYAELCERFAKMSGRFATLDSADIFNAKVTRAQESSPQKAKEVYAQLFAPWMKKGYTVALDPAGKKVDTDAFARLMEDRNEITFFLGGAYGHGNDFLRGCDSVISLSPLTMSHKVAKVVLFEQIYRALTILHNHPYHK